MKISPLFFALLLPCLLSAQSAEGQYVRAVGTATLTVSDGLQQGSSAGTSTEDFRDIASFSVYPNPLENELHLEVESSKALHLVYSLRDVLGRETSVPAGHLLVNGHAATTLDLSNLATGHYIMIIHDLRMGHTKSLALQKIK